MRLRDAMIASSPARPVAARRSDAPARASSAPRPRRQPAMAVDVVVERRGADAELRCDARERDRFEAVGVGDRDRRVDDLLAVQAAARHLGSARDRAVHLRARVPDDLAVPGGEPGGIERAQAAGGGERGRLVPRHHRREREARGLGAGRDAAERRVGVAGVERAVAGVEEREVPGRVARRGVDLERADDVAGLDRPRRPRLRAGDRAAQLDLRLVRVDRLVAGQQARVARGDQDLDAGELCRERVEAADVVLVGVGQRDPADRLPERLGGGQDPASERGSIVSTSVSPSSSSTR